jgi:phenylalanyl-tRNA synthetase beta chain
VRGIEIKPSPEWLKKRIEAVGLRPVNNVVDITNYILFATAHPIHAFSLDKITGGKIIVRRAKKGEFLKSLEGQNLSLSPEMLVIADEKDAIALAGIIGGEESGIQEGTCDIFIESACFDPVSIRKTSKKTGVVTDSSYRFERGADISFPRHAALMAASLLTQLGGKATKGIEDVYPVPKKVKTVILRNHRIGELLGLDIDIEFVVRTLSKLGFQVEEKKRRIWQVKVPYFRIDIEREADLIEEVARFYGYDKIPASIPPVEVFEPPDDPQKKRINKLRQLLFHYGFDEVVNFSFIDPDKEAFFQIKRNPIEIRNPFSSKASRLRRTLLGGLLENIAWNRNRGADGVHIFELGNIYFWDHDLCQERLTFALSTTGLLEATHWKGRSEETHFFHLKGALESLMDQLRYRPISFKEDSHDSFEKEYSLALLYKGITVGHLGMLKKKILEGYSLKEPIWAAELDLVALFEKQSMSFQVQPVVRFPSIVRDLSFIADKKVTYQDIKSVLEKLSIPYLETFDLYDRFSGLSIPEDKLSLSFRFVYRHPQRTLQAEEVDSFQKKIIDAFITSFNFQLREGGEN